MPIEVSLHAETSEIIHLQYGGTLIAKDYMNAITAMIHLMHETERRVHVLVERTSPVPETPSPLSILLYAHKHFPPNLGFIVLIKPSTYARTILTIAHSVTPRLVRNLHYVNTYEEGFEMIKEQIETKATGEFDE